MKQIIIALSRGTKLNGAITLALLCLWGGQVGTAAKSTPFSRIIVFGDSLSDTGNLHALSGGALPPYGTRFSNGKLWIEYVADHLGMPLHAEDNYAVGGATTGHDNYNNDPGEREYPGLLDQVGAFLAATPAHQADPEALYIVWAGANDFLFPQPVEELIRNGVLNTAQAVQRLAWAGARHIVVPNVPDLGLTPEVRGLGLSAAFTQLSAFYNEALATTLRALGQAGISTIQVDAFATLQTMASAPADFGFTNVTDACLLVLLAGGRANPAEFLFWDPFHPTTRAHEVLAEEAVKRILDHFSPRQGRGTPAARVNALNGLVNAGQGN